MVVPSLCLFARYTFTAVMVASSLGMLSIIDVQSLPENTRPPKVEHGSVIAVTVLRVVDICVCTLAQQTWRWQQKL